AFAGERECGRIDVVRGTGALDEVRTGDDERATCRIVGGAGEGRRGYVADRDAIRRVGGVARRGGRNVVVGRSQVVCRTAGRRRAIAVQHHVHGSPVGGAQRQRESTDAVAFDVGRVGERVRLAAFAGE